MRKKQHIIYDIHIICCMICDNALLPKKRYVQWWHHQQYLCILYQKKQLCSTYRNALRGTSAARLAEATTHTHRQHSMREALAHQQLRASTTHNSKCLRFATCTNCINYVSVQCRCNDSLSLFASFAYHLWKMVVKLPYCARSASCHHSVLYNYTHYTLNHWSSGR